MPSLTMSDTIGPVACAAARVAADARAARASGAASRRRRATPVERSCRAAAASRACTRRRDFMKLMGASLALAGGGCARPPLETIVPYRDGPAQQTLRQARVLRHARSRATATASACWSRPTWAGRPRSRAIPSHPASLGATDVFTPGRGARAVGSRPLAAPCAAAARRDVGRVPARRCASALRARAPRATAPGCAC